MSPSRVSRSRAVRGYLLAGAAAFAFLLVASLAMADDDPLLAPASSQAYQQPNMTGASTNFQVIGTQGTAQAYQCVGKVDFGHLRVENAQGILIFDYTGIKWGNTSGPWLTQITQFAGKDAFTQRGNGVMEQVTATDAGFEDVVHIPSSGGTGKIRLYGKFTTQLEIERTFGGDSTATVFTTDGPINLVNQQGARVLGLGLTRVIDANGDTHDCDVEYTKVGDGFTFITTVPSGWLSTAVYPITVHPLIGVPAGISTESVRADYESQAAYGGGQYFLVWTSKATAAIAVASITGAGDDIYARRLATDGTFIGPTFAVATGSAAQKNPHVAFAPAGGGIFAVVHKDGNNVVLKRYNLAGALLSTSTINDPTLSNRVTTVDIASNGIDKFCIVWSGYMATTANHQTWAEVRGADGSVITGDTLVGAAATTVVHARPSVIWNSTLSQWFFTWESYDGAIAAAPKQVYGRAFGASLASAAIPEILVSTVAGSNYDARVAWSATSNEYLVAFDNNPPTGKTNVHARRVNAADGTLLGTEFNVETNTKASTDVAVAWVPNSNRWVTAFELAGSGARGAYGQVLKADGTPTGPLFVLSDGADFGEIEPTLARAEELDQYLATWTDGSATTQDIWGARLDVTPPFPPGPVTTSNTSAAITLHWPNTGGADLSAYYVFRSLTPGGPYPIVLTLGGAIPPVGTTISWTDTAVVVNTRYYYVVVAVDKHANISDISAEASEIIDTIPPAPPTGLAATPGDTVVDLTWSPNTEADLVGYNAWYKRSSVTTWTKGNTTLLGTTAFTFTSLLNGVSYDFSVTAVDTEPNESARSAPISATPIDTIAPSAPTGLVATPGNRAVTLTWAMNPESDVTGYNVYRSGTSGGSYTKVNSAPVSGLTYPDSSLTNGTTYFYKITAVDSSSNEGPKSSFVSATPQYPKPTALTLDSSTDTSATFHWTGVGTGDLDGYDVWRSSTSGTGYFKVNTAHVGGTTYVDTGLTVGTWYWVVTAVSGSDVSPYSNEISVFVWGPGGPPPVAPTLSALSVRKTDDSTPNMFGTAIHDYFVTLYEDSIPVGTGFADGSGAFTIATTTLGDGQHTITATQQATTTSTESPHSAGVVVTIDTTPPAAPTGVRVLAGNGWAEISWDDNTEDDLLGYNLYRRFGGGAWEKQNDKPLVNPKYLDKPLTNGTAYEYRVTAVDNTVHE